MKARLWIMLSGCLLWSACAPATNPTPIASPKPSETPIIAASATSTVEPQPTSTPVRLIVQPQTVNMTVRRSGNWTVYVAAEWLNRKEPVTISSIAVAKDGTDWFGTMGGAVSIGTGIYHFDGKAWTRYTRENGAPSDEAVFVTAADKAVWAGYGGLYRLDGKTWTIYTKANGLVDDDVRAAAVAPDGTLWVGTDVKGVSHFDGTNWTTYNQNNGLWGYSVGHIGAAPDGSMLFSTSAGSGISRMSRFDGQHWTSFSVPPDLAERDIYAPGNGVTDWTSGPDGSLWFATWNNGVFEQTGNVWRHYTTQDGLASNQVSCAVKAQDGTLWFCTDQGISRFDGKTWTTFGTRDGLPSHWVESAAAAPDGSIWFGAASAVFQFSPAK